MSVSGNWQGNKRRLSRREFVAASGMSMAALAFGMGPLTGKAEAQPRFSDDPYSLGVASGDQLPGSVVIWTRLAPRPLEPFGGMTTRKAFVMVASRPSKTRVRAYGVWMSRLEPLNWLVAIQSSGRLRREAVQSASARPVIPS